MPEAETPGSADATPETALAARMADPPIQRGKVKTLPRRPRFSMNLPPNAVRPEAAAKAKPRNVVRPHSEVRAIALHAFSGPREPIAPDVESQLLPVTARFA